RASEEEHAEPELSSRLQWGGDAGVGRRDGHDRFPGTRGVSVLQVVLDESLVSRRCVQALAEVLEEHPDEHRAQGYAQQHQRALPAWDRHDMRWFGGQGISLLPFQSRDAWPRYCRAGASIRARAPSTASADD